ncbi:MAG: Holliday junction branch migration DNA helicase RuvB [Candidatus Pacebacteria bacterium]|jgi:holliday junction DNA helicase RuvB|nr:Holliday junction branch migration DNA helicase RuvB [Candidatus Paceibacterota bacterium]MBT3512262.1 Holliday junction branch migration DNA helicase RuvB [Candidatus Paceibacterota bacterium]MBT4004788.1 Holliday junction branch migration DNA helicase RuvB [Candidatus Paceibacterota bacterium]MBT4358702.1 Holliday junction branch migration DNA helicase RuvB [Candidatus Paceibacterota bacterium]MBT4680995.1 Holliday junction branch migration DNA helicase RuvB [Candidatus Paceibacterota bact
MSRDKVTPTTTEEELLFQSLRAHDWDEFIGQGIIRKALQLSIKAAKQRQEPLDHTLLFGPPGLGKTTLAYLIAQGMDSDIRVTSGTALSKTGDLAAILTNLKDGDILFIDEIHRLPKIVEETLYPAMEDYALDIVIGKGPSARTVRLDLPKFTIVGATTRFGLLAGPFRDRFGLIHRLTYYQPEPLAEIVTKAAKKLNVKIDQKSALEIGRRSRGTPRITLKLLKRVRDYAQVNESAQIDSEQVNKSLEMFAIDKKGLDQIDRRLLKKLIKHHQGGPVGLSTIAASLNEDPGTIEEVIEPYLLQIGFLKRTPKGRVVTKSAYEHLGEKYPEK